MAAGRLKPGRSWLPALLLPVAVLLAHAWLGEAIWQMQSDWRTVEPMPPRLRVSFVRTLQAANPVGHSAPARPARPARQLGVAAAMPDAIVAAGIEPLPPASEALLEALPEQAPVAAVVDAEPGPEWPLSTRLSYTLTGNFRGPVHGNSEVEWLRQGRHYQVRLVVAVGPRLAPLISRQMLSDGQLTPQGIAPRRFDEDTRVLIAPRQRKTMLFEDRSVTLADGRREAAPPGLQDAASQFVQLTWLFLTGREQMRAGLVVELPLALPRRQYLWGYRVLGEETLKTPIGPLSAWHLQPTRAPGGGDLTADVWLAPSLQYLPVRLLIREDAENFVDLMLDSLPLQEAAATVDSSTQTQENPP